MSDNPARKTPPRDSDALRRSMEDTASDDFTADDVGTTESEHRSSRNDRSDYGPTGNRRASSNVDDPEAADFDASNHTPELPRSESDTVPR